MRSSISAQDPLEPVGARLQPATRPEPRGSRPRRGPAGWLRAEAPASPEARAPAPPPADAGPIPAAYRVFDEFLAEGREAAQRWGRSLSPGAALPGAALPGVPGDALRVFVDALEQINGWSRLARGALGPRALDQDRGRADPWTPAPRSEREPPYQRPAPEPPLIPYEDPQGDPRIVDPHETEPPF